MTNLTRVFRKKLEPEKHCRYRSLAYDDRLAWAKQRIIDPEETIRKGFNEMGAFSKMPKCVADIEKKPRTSL